MFFWNKICGLMLVFFMLSVSCYAQNLAHTTQKQADSFSNPKIVSLDSSGLANPSVFLNTVTNFQVIPGDLSTCRYGFFCKKELVVEKAIKFPLRIRLGSLQQCNYYEGKK